MQNNSPHACNISSTFAANIYAAIASRRLFASSRRFLAASAATDTFVSLRRSAVQCNARS